VQVLNTWTLGRDYASMYRRLVIMAFCVVFVTVFRFNNEATWPFSFIWISTGCYPFVFRHFSLKRQNGLRTLVVGKFVSYSHRISQHGHVKACWYAYFAYVTLIVDTLLSAVSVIVFRHCPVGASESGCACM